VPPTNSANAASVFIVISRKDQSGSLLPYNAALKNRKIEQHQRPELFDSSRGPRLPPSHGQKQA
jgi:hypothetical protein